MEERVLLLLRGGMTKTDSHARGESSHGHKCEQRIQKTHKDGIIKKQKTKDCLSTDEVKRLKASSTFSFGL